MKESSYGAIDQTIAEDDISVYVEEISLKGFTVIKGLFTEQDLKKWRHKIDSVYMQQEDDFGRDELISIQELDVCRAPIVYDFDFINLAVHPTVLEVVKRFLGDWYILNLQNAVINRPNKIHHQSSWHRDLPYQNYIISNPLAINALIAIDEFSPETGGTRLVPFTHKTEILPSDHYIDTHQITASVPAGSVIMFDSMLFHKAGENTSDIIRRSVNHLYTTPMIKQQYDFSKAFHDKKSELSPFLERLLGFSSQVCLDDKDWRRARSRRLNGDK